MSRLDVVSPKVLAAGAGAGGGAVVGTLVLWIIGGLLFHGSWAAYAASDTVAAVPAPLHDGILYGLAIVGAIIAGYLKVDPDRNGPIPADPATDVEGEILPDVPSWDGPGPDDDGSTAGGDTAELTDVDELPSTAAAGA